MSAAALRERAKVLLAEASGCLHHAAVFGQEADEVEALLGWDASPKRKMVARLRRLGWALFADARALVREARALDRQTKGDPSWAA